MITLFCFISKFLYTNDINKIASTNQYLNKYFLGAYPADVFPEKIKFPSCWIWNTDEAKADGQHWVAIWVDEKKNFYFFDSFAKRVEFYKREYWIRYAKKNNLTFRYVQKNQLQSKITLVCGSWSLYYLYNKCRNEIEQTNKYSMFKSNKNKLINDTKLKDKISVSFGNVIVKIYNKKCKNKIEKKKPNNQGCCCFNKAKF